jgi:hypothetical protein
LAPSRTWARAHRDMRSSDPDQCGDESVGVLSEVASGKMPDHAI